MRKQILILLLGIILIVGVIGAGITGITPKDETINVRINATLQTWARSNIQSMYYNPKLIRIGNVTSAILTYSILENGEWTQTNKTVFLYNINEVTTTEEELLKQRMGERVESTIKKEYESIVKTVPTNVSAGKKTIVVIPK